MTVRLDAPIVVSSGHNVRGALRVNNVSSDAIVAVTNGIVTAQVVNPLTGELVGGYTGFQTAPLVRFEVAPGETTVIPLLVGTASANPALGHAVPGGERQCGRSPMPCPHEAVRGVLRVQPFGNRSDH